MTYFLAEDIFWWATCAKNHLYLQCFSGNGSAQSALVLVRGNDISNKKVQWSCSYQKFLAYKCLIVDMQRQGEKLNHCRYRSLIGFGKREKRKGNHGDLFPRTDFKFRASFHADFTNDVSVKVTTLGLMYSQSGGEPTHRWKQRYTKLQHLCWKLKKWNACSKSKKNQSLDNENQALDQYAVWNIAWKRLKKWGHLCLKYPEQRHSAMVLLLLLLSAMKGEKEKADVGKKVKEKDIACLFLQGL